MESYLGVTVEEVLSLVSDATLLAGGGGLPRLVRSVGVIEAPDSFGMVKPGDLILTALYAVRDDPAAQISLISELHDRGAAGVAVKKRYIDRLPAEMLKQADRLGLPLLELKVETAFSEVMLPVFSQIVNRQTSLLSRQLEAHRAVMKSVLEARGLPSLAKTLADLLGNPVVIQDQARQSLAATPWPEQPHIDLEALAAAEAISSEYRLSGGDALHRSEVVHAGARRISRIVTPIVSGERTFGQIVVWELDRPVSEMDLLIIDSVSTVVALEMANQRALLEVERRYKGEFLEALFAREIESEEALLHRARTFGWDLGLPHLAIALRVSGAELPGGQRAEELQRNKDRYFEAVARRAGPGMVGQAGLHTVVLLEPGSEDPREQAQRLLELAEPISHSLRVSAGIGRVQSGVQGLRKSFEEAVRAVSVGDRVWGGGAAYHYDDLGLYQLLSMLEHNDDLEQFLSAIDKLVDYERESRTDLVQTLETYFACKGNVRKVSERLFAHYNTVLYRLERIQQITGVPLEDATGRLHLQVALQAARLFGKLPASARH